MKQIKSSSLYTTILGLTIAISGCQSGSSGSSTTEPTPIEPIIIPLPTPAPMPLPVPGTLQISSFSESNILSNGEGKLATATVSLNSSSNVNSITVYFPNESGILVTPSSCVLGTESNICTITVTGESVNPSATVVANSPSYTSVTSTPLNVYAQVTSEISKPVGNTPTYSVKGIQVKFSGAIESSTLSNADFIVSTSANNPIVEVGTFTTDDGESVVTFTPYAAFNFNESYSLTVTNEVTDANGQPTKPLVRSFSTQNALEIYVATNNGNGWNGNLLSAGHAINSSVTTGIEGADALCQADPGCPVGSTCQAMIVDNNGTRAAVPNIKWVLQSSTPYMNESGVLIGTTTESAVFSMPLESAINSNYYSLSVWTGLVGYLNFGQNIWGTSTKNTCHSWTTDSGVVGGQTANPLFTSSEAVGFIGNGCETVNPGFGLYCVQQPVSK